MLGRDLQERESSFYGDYWIARFDGIEVRVVPQIDPSGDPQEEEFVDYGILVYLDSPAAVEGIAGLRTESGVIELLR